VSEKGTRIIESPAPSSSQPATMPALTLAELGDVLAVCGHGQRAALLGVAHELGNEALQAALLLFFKAHPAPVVTS